MNRRAKPETRAGAMRVTDCHLDGTPWHLTLYEVAIALAAARVQQRALAALVVPVARPDDTSSPRKKCRHCKKRLPLERFTRHPTTGDGLDGRCKDCKRIYDRKRAAQLREAAGRRN